MENKVFRLMLIVICRTVEGILTIVITCTLPVLCQPACFSGTLLEGSNVTSKSHLPLSPGHQSPLSGFQSANVHTCFICFWLCWPTSELLRKLTMHWKAQGHILWLYQSLQENHGKDYLRLSVLYWDLKVEKDVRVKLKSLGRIYFEDLGLGRGFRIWVKFLEVQD